MIGNVYGFLSSDIDHIARKLEDILNINFELHDSSFRGGDYYLYEEGVPWEKEIYLQKNLELDDELAEPDHPEYKLILYIYVIDDQELEVLHNKIVSGIRNEVEFIKKEI